MTLPWPGAAQLMVTLSWATPEAVRPVGAAGGSSLTRAVAVSVQGPLHAPLLSPPLVYRARALTLNVAPLVSPGSVMDRSDPLGYSFPRFASLEFL